MSKGVFLKLSGGYIHIEEIRWAEQHDDALVVSLRSKQQPIVLRGDDRTLVEAYLDSRLWDPLSTREAE